MSQQRSFRVALAGLALSIAACLAGCSDAPPTFASSGEFREELLSRCLRSESEFNPRPMRLSTLKKITGEPLAIETVDPSTQKWDFEFPDGTQAIYVVLEPGNDWEAKRQQVFVDVQRSGLIR